ncbi:MAG TPA: DUF92 domain-containing protein, partial [Gemmatimonadales bacterium]|nr:DUF92 domain-containing protein [Gemmatimonadales bacterium]
LLLAFFVSSSLLTAAAKKPAANGGEGRRNARQVIANGGIAALAALAGNWVWFAGALAAANADTWATEIGSHSPTPPRLITNWTTVPPGTDGGMTLLGTAGGLAGAGLVGALSYLLGQDAAMALIGAGTAGMIMDSLLGAIGQGTARWIDNDAVNLAATLTGAGCAGLLA